MSYYDTIAEDLKRAKEILAKGSAESEMHPDIHVHLSGGTIYGADTYAAYKLLESFVQEIEGAHTLLRRYLESHGPMCDCALCVTTRFLLAGVKVSGT